MQLKIAFALAHAALSLIWPMVSEAGWRNRWVCHAGTATGGGSSSTTTVCGWESYCEHEGVPEDPGFGGAGGPGGSGGWTPTYYEEYTDLMHSCSLSELARTTSAAQQVRAHALDELGGTRGRLQARQITIRGTGGSREIFEIIAGEYAQVQVLGTSNWIRPVPNSCSTGGA